MSDVTDKRDSLQVVEHRVVQPVVTRARALEVIHQRAQSTLVVERGGAQREITRAGGGIQGPPGVQGATVFLPNDVEAPDEPLMMVGPQGPRGPEGVMHAVPPNDPDEPGEPWMVPGPPGPESKAFAFFMA